MGLGYSGSNFNKNSLLDFKISSDLYDLSLGFLYMALYILSFVEKTHHIHPPKTDIPVHFLSDMTVFL